MESQTQQRKSKGRKPVTPVTYRLTPSVKLAVAKVSELTGRSENQQAEQMLKAGYLNANGINVYGMSDIQIAERFDHLTQDL